MSWVNRFADLFRRGRVQSEIDEEMRFHLEARIRQNRQNGMTERDGRLDALRRSRICDTACARCAAMSDSLPSPSLLWRSPPAPSPRFSIWPSIFCFARSRLNIPTSWCASPQRAAMGASTPRPPGRTTCASEITRPLSRGSRRTIPRRRCSSPCGTMLRRSTARSSRRTTSRCWEFSRCSDAFSAPPKMRCPTATASP